MNHGSDRLKLLGMALLASCLIPACAGAAEGSFERTLKVTGPVELEVTTGSGSINVTTGDSSTVRIRGTIRTGRGWHFGEGEAESRVRTLESNPPIEQNANFIRVGHIEDRSLTRNISISYDLVVPAATRLRADTGSGGLSITGLRGPVRVKTGSGNLRIDDIGDELHADTGSGDIEVQRVNGRLYASTGSGPIRATGISGAFVLTTGSGDVRLEQTSSGEGRVETGSGTVELRGLRGALHAKTGSGSITADGDLVGDWSLESGSGNLTVRVPSQAAFNLEAHTSSGHITSAHDITVQGTIGRNDLRGRVGTGGFRLDLHTGSGNIQIE
jgi:putative adhesin